MSIEIVISGTLSTVFATIGVALPIILALTAYIVIWLKNVTLTPPAATRGESSIGDVGTDSVLNGLIRLNCRHTVC